MYYRLLQIALVVSSLAECLDQISEVVGLRGSPEYRHVSLRWEYPRYGIPANGFQIHYCELQAWGPNRCKNKLVESSTQIEDSDMPSGYKSYSVIIHGLRMSTNYSFTVRPLEARKTRYLAEKTPRSTIILATKGFSARAVLCLPDTSEVEVSTGPHFSGRIAVEGALGQECSLEGIPSSPKESYLLKISHSECGSKTNSTAVATFILVQENLPILTHSTRRFLVVCTFHPETLTVRAGLNLPHTSHGSVEPQTERENNLAEVSSNEVLASPLKQDESRSFKEEDEAQIVVTMVAVIAGLVGVGLAIWWFIPFKRTSESESILTGECSVSVLDNFENSIRGGEISESDRAMGGAYNPVLREQLAEMSINIDQQAASEA